VADGHVAADDPDHDLIGFINRTPAPRARDLGARNVRHPIHAGSTTTDESNHPKLSKGHVLIEHMFDLHWKRSGTPMSSGMGLILPKCASAIECSGP
jgi:hypothetical protein